MSAPLPSRWFFYTSRCFNCSRELMSFQTLGHNLPPGELDETDAPVAKSVLDGVVRCAHHERGYIARRAAQVARGIDAN